MFRPLTKEDIHVGLKFISKNDPSVMYTISRVHEVFEGHCYCNLFWIWNGRPDSLSEFKLNYKYYETDYEYIVDLDEDDGDCV